MKIRERRCDACDEQLGNRFTFKTRGWERNRHDSLMGDPDWPRRIELCESCWCDLPLFVFEKKEARRLALSDPKGVKE